MLEVEASRYRREVVKNGRHPSVREDGRIITNAC